MVTKKEQTELSFGSIWEKLNKVDCSKVSKSKNNLTYLAWNESWALLMEHYPEATFAYMDNEVYSDGSVSVVCQVEIHGFVRRMWLPVMNYANKVIPSPSSREISDNKMRCLVKTIALFGLGFHIYRGKTQPEDMIDDPLPVTTRSVPHTQGPPPAPKGVATPAAKPVPAAEPAPENPDELYLQWGSDEAQVWVDQMIAVAKEMMKTPDDLRHQWHANKKTIDYLTTTFPDVYASLRNQFTELATSLTPKEETNE